MTKLNGSEKQIAWAKQIRETILNGSICQGHCVNEGISQHIEKLGKSIERYENKKPAKTEEMMKMRLENIKAMKNQVVMFEDLKNKIESETSASWFIDNRNSNQLFEDEIFSK